MLIRQVTQKAQYLLIEKHWLIFGIFIVGIFIRIYELDQRPLWIDEAWVANLASSDNISTAFFDKKHTPPFFISLLYASVHMFPNNEWFLRIVPAFFSIGGMVLIYLLVHKWLGKIEAVGALLLFTFMPVILAYSRELKQYTCDIFFALLLLFIMERILDNPRSGRLWAVLAVTGGVGLWFSYPVAYVLSSVGISLLYHIFYDEHPKPEKHKLLLNWFFTLSAILISIGLLYYFVISSQMSGLTKLQFTKSSDPFWAIAFPDVSGIRAFVEWFGLSVWSFFPYFWNGYAPFVFPVSLVGTWYLYRSGRRRILLYWGIIFVSLLAASFMVIFPFAGFRVTLFTAPIFIILFISGLKALWVHSRNKMLLKPLAYLGLLLLAIQVSDAAVYYKNGEGYYWFKQYPQTEDIKSALNLLDRERNKRETVYIYYGSKEAFEYYSKQYYKKSYSPIIMGANHRDDFSLYINDLTPLILKRKPFWLLATHIRLRELNYIHHNLLKELDYLSRVYLLKDGAALVYYYPQGKL